MPKDLEHLNEAVRRRNPELFASQIAETLKKRRNAQPEKTLQKAVMDYAAMRGWRVLHIPPVQCVSGQFFTAYEGQGRGFVDLLLARDRVLFVELKAGNNELEPEQKNWEKALKAAGAIHLVWRLEDWTSGEIERILR